MNIFNTLDYRLVLKMAFAEQKKKKISITLDKMAQFCKIQKTYLSKVINHSANLSQDQLYLASKYLNFNKEESHYIFLLHSYDSCQVQDRKENLLAEIHQIQHNSLSSEKHLKINLQNKLSTTSLTQYYSDPYLIFIHIFLTISTFAKNQNLICDKLNLSKEQVSLYIDDLISMGFVEKKTTAIKVIQDNIHLPANSFLIKSYLSQMRIMSIAKNNSHHPSKKNSDYSFSVLFSTQESIKEKIHERFLEFIKDTQKLTEKSKEEDLYQINFDLLKWS